MEASAAAPTDDALKPKPLTPAERDEMHKLVAEGLLFKIEKLDERDLKQKDFRKSLLPDPVSPDEFIPYIDPDELAEQRDALSTKFEKVGKGEAAFPLTLRPSHLLRYIRRDTRNAHTLAKSHPAAEGLTDKPGRDEGLLPLIERDWRVYLASHGMSYEHLTCEPPCPDCTQWMRTVAREHGALTEIVDLLFAKTMKKELERGGTLYEKAVESVRESIDFSRNKGPDQIDAQKRQIEALQEGMKEKDATLATQDNELKKAYHDLIELKATVEQLKIEIEENAARKTLVRLCRMVFTREDSDRFSKEGALLKNAETRIQELLEFHWQEKGKVDLREKARKELGAMQKELVLADRISLRDKGYPKYANRVDLIRALWPMDSAKVEQLLSYRHDWDAKLHGETVNPATYEKVMEGYPAWFLNAGIDSLPKLSKASKISRATWRRYHELGIVDLTRFMWSVRDRKDPAPSKPGRRPR